MKHFERITLLLIFLAILIIPFWMMFGKFQLCKFYFKEMNRVACFFTQLPAAVTK